MKPLERELQRDRNITRYEIIAELQRELEMRRKLYPSWCATGRITVTVAGDRIRTLEEAIADLQTFYREDLPTPITQLSLLSVPSDPVSQFRSR
jgi:hypothetical protein